MIRFVVCARCGLVLAIGTWAKKTVCPRCQSPVTARSQGQVETKTIEREVAA